MRNVSIRSSKVLASCVLGLAALSAACVPPSPPKPPPGPDSPDAHYVLLPGVVGMDGTGFDFVMRSGSSGNTVAAREVVRSVVEELNTKTGSTHRLLAGTTSGPAGPNQIMIFGVPDAGVACNYPGAIGCAGPNLENGYIVGGNVIYEGGLESNRQLFAHEIGHALGLGHCIPNPAQIMCNDQDALTHYNTGDINGFRWLLTQQRPAARTSDLSKTVQYPPTP